MDGHGVVIGASMAGLSASRVLADRYERVTVLDRDHLPAEPVPRRSVPQGHHGHIMLVSGMRVLNRLFPGLDDDMIAAGATRFDTGEHMLVYRFGRRWPAMSTGLDLISASRPQLEAVIRARVAALPNVTIRDGVAVGGLTGTDDRVTGVVLDDGETVPADLVVDCSGRGARSDRWLRALGFPAPEQVEIKIGVAYSTRLYRRSPGQLYGRAAALLLPDPRRERHSGIALPIEGDRWLVAVGGWHLTAIAEDAASFESAARALPDPMLADLLAEAEPVTEPVSYRFPSSRRRRFEDLDRRPAGYVALGDAICSFNPIYGQGMTCAAMEAEALGEALDRHGTASAELAAGYYRAAARVIAVPWQFAVGGDFAYPETTGPRPKNVGFTNWYARTIAQASQLDARLNRTFSAVQQLVEPPAAMFRPGFVAKVLWQTLRRHALWRHTGRRRLSAAPSR